MHFWIDKRSLACGFRRGQRIPPSLSGYPLLYSRSHLKPMVTPVHRFQNIESVAENCLRYTRAQNCHTRSPAHYQTGSASVVVRNPNRARSTEILANGPDQSPTPHQDNAPTSRLKCGVWAFFAVITFFIAGAKYYFHGGIMSTEALVIYTLLVSIMIIGGLIWLYGAIRPAAQTLFDPDLPPTPPLSPHDQQEINEDLQNQVPSCVVSPVIMELPPPPYHIAVMLPPQTNDPPPIIRDSPPPSYEKAMT